MNSTTRVRWGRRVVLLTSACLLAAAEQGLARTDTLAITNDAAPDGNGFIISVTPTSVVLNDSGQAVFWGNLVLTNNGTNDDFGIFLGEVGHPLVQVVRELQAAPGGGTFSLFNGVPSLNQAGEVAFKSTLLNTANPNAVFKFSGGSLTEIVRTGDAAPDGDGTFNNMNNGVGINNLGDIAFGSSLSGTANTSGVFLASSAGVQQLARTGQTAPDGNGEFSSFNFFLPLVNDNGEVVFSGNLTNTAGGSADDRGHFTATTSGVRRVAREGQVSPDPAQTILEFTFGGTALINDSGAVAFGATLNDPGGTGNDRGLFLKPSANAALQLLVFEGEAAPDGNGVFETFSAQKVLKNGEVIFGSSIGNTSGGSTDDFGLYLTDGGQITRLIREGELMPGGDGTLQVATVQGFQFNDTGQAVLLGEATNTAGGTDEPVILLHGAGETIEAVRQGDALEGSTIDSLSISSTPSFSSINKYGQVAFQATLANARDGAFLFTPDLNYRRGVAGDWDDADSWTLGINPAPVHDVTIRPDAGVVVDGPTLDVFVKSLTVGAAVSGTTTLSLQGGAIVAEDGLTLEASGEVNGAGVIVGAMLGPSPTTRINPTAPLQRNASLGVGSQTATVVSLGPADLGPHTTLAGGTINAPNGVTFAPASVLDAEGTINGRISASFGSIQRATGNLTLGDAAHLAGYASDGELVVDQHTVTLLDANQAVLGSHTTLGSGTSPGTLAAANGAVVEFGKSITGFGTVNTPDDPFKPLTNNGHITGNSPAEPITLTGFVRGVGTLDSVVITGTDAPGFSPATVYRGSVTYAGALEVEIGGTSIGSFDRIIQSGTATLGGALDVLLINGFTPSAGDSFDILDWGSVTGGFNTLNLPALGGDLDWDVSNLLIDGTLSVFSTVLQGDLNGDGFVGIADLNIVLGNWNQNIPPGDPQADPSGDGFVGIEDLNTVLGNWNAGSPPGGNAVPEPGTLSVLGLFVVAGARRRSRVCSVQ